MIKNDQQLALQVKERFRLLNSEIGNDQKKLVNLSKKIKCFRLLNSEIGNDRKRV